MGEPRRTARQNHLALAREALAVALDRGLGEGDHLPEQAFSDACGVSRTPIRSAFKLLEENDIAEWRPDEGYFLKLRHGEEIRAALRRLEEADDSLATRILADRAARRIADVQSVSALVRRYDSSRHTVLSALKILSRDGLVSQLPGRAWAFQPIIDSPASLEESFDFRLTLEPQAILAPGFAVDPARANMLRAQMEDATRTPETGITPSSFERLDAEFHTAIAEWSGNRFLRMSLLAHHRLRRAGTRGGQPPGFRLKEAMGEHLGILDSLDRAQFDLAADQMAVHLRRSRTRRPEAANRGIAPLRRGPGA